MTGILIAQVDAFASTPFSGNPAAVCVLTEDRDAEWMQRVAAEMHVPNTAFVRRRPSDDGFDVRWFTSRVEIQLCGHATLASAHILWETGLLDASARADFHTASGLLTATQNHGWIEIDFPATPVTPADAPDDLVGALGVTPTFVGRSRFDYVIEVDGEAAVRAVRPDLARLAAIPGRGVIVTSRSSRDGADFVSRFFAPAVGIDEDAATGSAHCALGPFWSERLGKCSLVGHQLSDRGAVLKVDVRGDRVGVAGKAVTIVRGELLA